MCHVATGNSSVGGKKIAKKKDSFLLERGENVDESTHESTDDESTHG